MCAATVRCFVSRAACARVLVVLKMAALLSCLARCTSLAVRPGGVTIADLRRIVRQHPEDLIARRDRALSELVAPGGDLYAGQRELEALRARMPRDPRVHYGLALAELQHGEFDRAARDLAMVIDTARTSRDPLGGAVAEIAVTDLVGIRGNLPGFESVFRPVVEAVVRDPGRLGAPATFRILETAVRWARERGLHDEETRWVRASGCVTEWTVAGPFGAFPMLAFDERFPPEEPGPLAHDYDLGPGRGRRPTWQVRARGCASNLGRGYTESGVFYAASDFVLAREGDVVVHVQSPNVFTVLIDGVPVATLDGRRRPTGTGLSVPLRLAAGRHTLRVKVASRYFSPLLVAAVTDGSGRAVATFERARGGAHPRVPEVLVPAERFARVPFEGRNDPVSLAIAGALAFARHDPIAAREAFRPLATASNPTSLMLIAWGTVALADPFVPPNVARDRARRAFEAARRSDPRAYYPSVALARLAAADDRGDEALALIRSAYRQFPDNPEIQSELAERLMDRYWDGEAREILERAARSLPGVCWPVRRLLALAQRHADGETERRLAEQIRGCDALSDAGALTALRQRRWRDAREEFERLLGSDPEARGFRRALVDVARQQGDLEQAARRAREILDENPEDTSLRIDLADLEVALGRTGQAIDLLEREIARSPSAMADLFRYRDVLSRRREIAPWRLDGRAVLRAFDASGRRYDASAVLVLDYTARRVFPDGSALEVTHNIIRLQSQEGVDAHATFTPPEGAMLLTLRTHKADGRILEPDAIARLDAVAFPDVGIGDAIEFEYVRALPASELAPGGFSTERFYFRGFDIPYDRSELVVVVPREMAARLLIEPRGPAPETQRRELNGALVEYRWVVHQSQRMTPEPGSVAPREYIPSVAVGVDATWDRYVEALRDRLADLDPYDPEAARLSSQIVGNARTASEKLVRLHRWVLEHIDQEGAGTPFVSAPVMVAGRSGHRTRVLCYLLELQGVRCRLALVRQASGDATEGRLADDSTYPSVLLRVWTERGEQWVTAADRGAPVTWLPPALAGQPALVIDRGAPRTRVPSLDLSAHRREITVRLMLERDGSARAEVTERLRGWWAISWRDSLRRIDPANLEREFESYVGRQVTAASLTSLRIEGKDDPYADVVLHYEFTAPSVASPSTNGLTFEGIYLAELGASYARVPQRTTTQYNAEPVDATLDLSVVLPPGARVTELPPARAGHAPGIEWSARYERTREGFRFRRWIRIPAGRIAPDDYSRFAAQVRAVDAADTQRVFIRVE